MEPQYFLQPRDPETSIDDLARLFPQIEAAGLQVPDDMPLDTPEHRRAAAHFLNRVLFQVRRGQETWLEKRDE